MLRSQSLIYVELRLCLILLPGSNVRLAQPVVRVRQIVIQIQRSPVKPFYGRVALAALMLTVSLVVVLDRPAPPKKVVPFPVMALSTWRSPTQSLLHSAADPLLRRVPRLGEKFFETKPTGDKNAQ